MASGSFIGTTNNKYISSRIVWSSTVDQVNNRSTVTAKFYAMKSSDSSAGTSGNGTWYVTIDGQRTTFDTKVTLNANDSWVLIGTATKTVTHDADGTKSIVISGTGGTDATSWTSTTCSQTVTLDSIPRGTAPTFDSTTKVIGSVLQITLNRADSSFTHTLSYIWQGVTYTIATNVATSYNWTIPSSFASDLTTAESAVCYIQVETFNGNGVSLGTISSPVTCTISSGAIPTISAITCTDTGGQINSSWGVFVLGKSTLHVKVTASGSQGSTITRYSITALGQTRTTNDVDIGVINSTSVTVSVTVTDSRGRTATQSKSISVIAYTPPTVSIVSLVRANSYGNPVDNGTYAAIKINALISSVKSGSTERNSMSIRIYHKRSDVSSWTLARTISPAGTSLTDTTYMISNMVTTRSYAYKVEVSDALSTSPSIAEAMLPAEGGLISWMDGGTGISFGKAAEEANRADFGWMIHARQGIVSDVAIGIASGGTGATSAAAALTNLGAAAAAHGHALTDAGITGILPNAQVPLSYILSQVYPIGSIYLTTSNVNPGLIFGGEWTQIKDKFILAAGDTYSQGATGGAAAYELSVSHNHLSPIGYSSKLMGLVSVNGYTSAGSGNLYRSITATNSGSDLGSNINMLKTKNATVSATIPTIPPYLAVYVWQRTA